MSNSKSEEVVEEKAEEVIEETTELEVEEKTETEEVIETKDSDEAVEEKAETDDIEVKAEAEEAIEDEMEKDDEEDVFVARDPNESIPFVNLLSTDASELQNGDLVNYQQKMYKVAKIATEQSPIFKFLEIDAEGNDCDNVLNVKTDDISQVEP